jgi:hypothetical protein
VQRDQDEEAILPQQNFDLTGPKYQQINSAADLGLGGANNGHQSEEKLISGAQGPRQFIKKGKGKNKEIRELPKMKIIVKSTKTISFDGQFNSDDHMDEEEESESEKSEQQPATKHQQTQ